MILLNLVLSTPAFVAIIIGVCLVSLYVGSLIGGSWEGTSQQDIEEAGYLKDWREKKETPIIDIDNSLVDSMRYPWRPEKVN